MNAAGEVTSASSVRRSRRAGSRVLAAGAFALGACGLPACGSSAVHGGHGVPHSQAPAAVSSSIVTARIRVARTKLGAVAYRAVGSGPPVVLIMGASGTMEDWDPRLVDVLAHGHRVVIFDNAGIGLTQTLANRLTIDGMANQTSALIAALRLGRPDVLGWSMGGMIAQALAVRHPTQVGRLVLCATQAGTGHALSPPVAAAIALNSQNPLAVLATLFPGDQRAAARAYALGVLGYAERPVVRRAVVLAQRTAIAEWLNGADAAGRRASTIAVPTLVADGSVDAVDPVSNDHELASLIPHARLVLYPDAGHGFLFQDETMFVPRIEMFLR